MSDRVKEEIILCMRTALYSTAFGVIVSYVISH